mmetsp:Transcript_20293/g.50644  ORF Transcript_20293/g.50644 Transcript_20293/m.50644 type:complete len:116 (+) Transcript_20293:4497-4844(+)
MVYRSLPTSRLLQCSLMLLKLPTLLAELTILPTPQLEVTYLTPVAFTNGGNKLALLRPTEKAVEKFRSVFTHLQQPTTVRRPRPSSCSQQSTECPESMPHPTAPNVGRILLLTVD